MLEQTLTGNNKVQLDPFYPVIAGVDETRTPQLLKVNPDGTLVLGGLSLPAFDSLAVVYIGSTNNIYTVTYSLTGTGQVAHWTFTYLGGGASNDDLLTGAAFAIP